MGRFSMFRSLNLMKMTTPSCREGEWDREIFFRQISIHELLVVFSHHFKEASPMFSHNLRVYVSTRMLGAIAADSSDRDSARIG